ncbi:MAG: PAC2 family protein [Candidatus Methanomethylophilaceae archaeon]|nr:PAC2 family protein [Candidatus Methanomethylophilaceae archaeon]
MANIITYDSKPELHDPVLIEGLPGVGNVGKIAADFVSGKLNARRMARILSEDLPPQVILDDECVVRMACHELWVAEDIGGHDLVFLLGDYQGTTPQGQFLLSQCVVDMLLPHGLSMIVTLGGYGTGTVVTDPRVLGAVSDAKMKSRMETYGVQFSPGEPRGGIVGAAAVLVGLGQNLGIESICIMGETSGVIVDHKSARCVIEVLGRMFGTEFDTSEMQEFIDNIDQLNSQSQVQAVEAPPEDLSYIG